MSSFADSCSPTRHHSLAFESKSMNILCIFLDRPKDNEMSQRRRQSDKKPSHRVQDEQTSFTDALVPEIRKGRDRSLLRVSTYFLVCLAGALISWSLFPMFHVEHTNIPINLPKLVDIDHSPADRFWGTYR